MLHRPAKLADAFELAPLLRPEDVEEIYASTGTDPLTSLVNNVHPGEGGETHVFLHPDDGGVIGMFGVGPSEMPTVGIVWAVASPRIVDLKAHLTETHKGFMVRWHERWPVLGNVIDARNAFHIKWIQRMGYVLGATHEKWGFEQRPFIAFTHQIGNKSCAEPPRFPLSV